MSSRDPGAQPGAAPDMAVEAAVPPGAVVRAGPGHSVPAGPGTCQGPWRSFGVSDGVPVAGVEAILRDREGRMWFAHGVWRWEAVFLSCYDGRTWTIFTRHDGLPANRIRRMTEDRGGGLWLATDQGACRFDGQSWTVLTTDQGLPSNDTFDILEDCSGALWVATKAGLVRFCGGSRTTFTCADGLPEGRVYVIFEDSRQNMWAGTGYQMDSGYGFAPSGGLARYAGGRWHHIADLGSRVRDIREDGQGVLWVATWGRGVGRWDGSAWSRVTAEDGLAGDNVTALWSDRAGIMWFATYGSGVSRFDGRTWTTFTVADGLANQMVMSLGGDREGGVWLGAVGGGISRYDANAPTSYTTADGLAHSMVMSLMEDRQGRLWFATWGGVSRYDGRSWVTYSANDGACAGTDGQGEAVAHGFGSLTLLDECWAIVEDRRGHIWVACPRLGVRRYDGEGWIRFTPADGVGGWLVKDLLVDRDGHVWVSSEDDGVSRYEGQVWRRFGAQDGLIEADARVLCQDRQGRLWVGTSRSLRVYEGAAFRSVKDGQFGAVAAICEDAKGHMWFGALTGLYRYDGREWTRLTTQHGLASDHVRALLEDDRGVLWIGTLGGGVNLYDGRVFQSITRVDGLAHDIVQKIIQTRNGDILIATEGGVTRYRSARTPPTIRMVAVIAERHHGPVEHVEVPSSQDCVRFEFQGASLQTPSRRMVYIHRLQGFDEAWQVTREIHAEYSDLPLGEYVFEVQAVDRDLNYSVPATVRVCVVRDPLREALSDALSGSGTNGEFLGNSRALRLVQKRLREVAPTDVTVLIQGETGSGKGLAARALHKSSRRAAGPLIQVNCGALPESLVESELFGHEKGAFTGAVSRKLGKVELASEGSLFLDEMGDMPLAAQVKLLRLLEEGSFERVGGTQTLQADVRVIAATNRDLQQMVAKGQFRVDLYYRLSGFPVRLPALRERREDIVLLALYFMEKMAAHLGKQVRELEPEAIALLQAHAWPGNVRELEHAMQRAVIVCREPVIRAGDLMPESATIHQDAPTGGLTPEEYEREYIRAALDQTGWTIKGPTGAAARLGLSATTLRRRMERLGIRRQ